MTTTLQIRPSTISSMMLCPARQILKRDDDAGQTAEALLFGTMTHWRIEQHLLGETGFDFDRMASKLKELYYEETNGGQLLDVITKRQAREFINEVMVAYEAWLVEVAPNLPDEAPVLEKTLEAKIWSDDRYEIYLTGTPDAMFLKDGLIADWKTAGRNWNADKVDGQVQPWAYTLLASFNGIEISQFDFWVYDRATESWWRHVHSLPYMNTAHEALIHQAAAFAILEHEGIPIYSPAGSGFKARGSWHCSPNYCDQWGRCKGKYLIADGKAHEPALDPITKGWQ